MDNLKTQEESKGTGTIPRQQIPSWMMDCCQSRGAVSRDVCNLQLHKITSNSIDIMSHFPSEGGTKSMKDFTCLQMIFQPWFHVEHHVRYLEFQSARIPSCGLFSSDQTPGPGLNPISAAPSLRVTHQDGHHEKLQLQGQSCVGGIVK